MRIEQLESRRLLSVGAGVVTLSSGAWIQGSAATATVLSGTLVLNTVHKPGETVSIGGVNVSVTSKGTLQVEGSTLNDSITVSTNKKSYTINVLGIPSFFFSRAEIKRIRIEGGAGKDTLTFTGNHPDVPVSLLGGDGNDTIRSSPGTTLIGGEGDDNLSASGVQTFVSAIGNTTTLPAQTIVYNTTGAAYTGGGKLLPAGVVFNSTGSNFVLVGSTDTDTGSLIEGGNGNDTITASAGPDTLNGGRGSDAITRTVFNNDTLIPIDGDISPGDTVISIEAFKVSNAASIVQLDNGNVFGAVTVQPAGG